MVVLYIVIAAAWCLLASFPLAICRLSALSDDAYTLELADRLVASRLRGHDRTQDEATVEEPGEARRATG